MNKRLSHSPRSLLCCVVALTAAGCGADEEAPAKQEHKWTNCSPSISIESQPDFEKLIGIKCINGDLTIGPTLDSLCGLAPLPYTKLNIGDAFAELESVSGYIRFTSVDVGNSVDFPKLESTSTVEMCMSRGPTDFGFPVLRRGGLKANTIERLEMKKLEEATRIEINDMKAPLILPVLRSAGTILIRNNKLQVSLPNLVAVAENLSISGQNHGGSTLVHDFPKLESVGEAYYPVWFRTPCAGPVALFPKLRTAENLRFAMINDASCDVILPALESSTKSMSFEVKKNRMNIVIPSLVDAKWVSTSGNVASLDMPNLLELDRFGGTAGLERLSLPKVSKIRLMSLMGSDSLKHVDLSSLKSVEAFHLTGAKHAVKIIAPELESGGTISVVNNTGMSDWPFPKLSQASKITVSGNTHLDMSKVESLKDRGSRIQNCGNGGQPPCTWTLDIKAQRLDRLNLHTRYQTFRNREYAYDAGDLSAKARKVNLTMDELLAATHRAIGRKNKGAKYILKAPRFGGAQSAAFFGNNDEVLLHAYVIDKKRNHDLRKAVILKLGKSSKTLGVLASISLPKSEPNGRPWEAFSTTGGVVLLRVSEPKGERWGPVVEMHALREGAFEKLPEIDLGRIAKDRWVADSPALTLSLALDGGELQVAFAWRDHRPDHLPIVVRLKGDKWIPNEELQNTFAENQSYEPPPGALESRAFYREEMKKKKAARRLPKRPKRVGKCRYVLPPPKCRQGTKRIGSPTESYCVDGDGKKNGIYREWHSPGCSDGRSPTPNGQRTSAPVRPKYETRFVHGVEVGPRIEFDRSGAFESRTPLNAEGQPHGRMTTADATMESGVYMNGKKIGFWTKERGSMVEMKFYPFDGSDVLWPTIKRKAYTK